MKIDHIFIVSQNNGKEADILLEHGFVEGSRRSHPGQGTSNRKFYFNNFFLEVLFITHPTELMLNNIQKTGLTQRLAYQKNGISPFGLCISNEKTSDELFANALYYQPDYFDDGAPIQIIPNRFKKSLPWIFRLPFPSKSYQRIEPFQQKNNIKNLDRAVFKVTEELPPLILKNIQNTQFEFRRSTKYGIELFFDHCSQGKSIAIEELFLQINY